MASTVEQHYAVTTTSQRQVVHSRSPFAGFKPFHSSTKPLTEVQEDYVNRAAFIPLREGQRAPKWWGSYYRYASNNPHFPSKPEILDVISTLVGDLVVVWQDESLREHDMTLAWNNGSQYSICYLMSYRTGEPLGFVKTSVVTDDSFGRCFGDDEFTLFRWREKHVEGKRYNFNIADGHYGGHYGHRNLSGVALTMKRREVWHSMKQDVRTHVPDEYNGGVIPLYGFSSAFMNDMGTHPSDEIVEKDLIFFRKNIKNQVDAFRLFNEVPFVSYSELDVSLRGKGLGSALYVYTSRKLAEHGRVLRASNLQSDKAKNVWKNLNTRLPGNISEQEFEICGNRETSFVLNFNK